MITERIEIIFITEVDSRILERMLWRKLFSCSMYFSVVLIAYCSRTLQPPVHRSLRCSLILNGVSTRSEESWHVFEPSLRPRKSPARPQATPLIIQNTPAISRNDGSGGIPRRHLPLVIRQVRSPPFKASARGAAGMFLQQMAGRGGNRFSFFLRSLPPPRLDGPDESLPLSAILGPRAHPPPLLSSRLLRSGH
jgi:hypothetical protein